MEEDVKHIFNELIHLFAISNEINKISDIFLNRYYKASPEANDVLVKYHDYTVNDLITLLKIARLYDLKFINEEERDDLFSTFIEYRRIKELIKKMEFSGIMKSNSSIDLDEYSTIVNQKNSLTKKLSQYDLLRTFDYKEAFMFKVDHDILKYELNEEEYTKKRQP